MAPILAAPRALLLFIAAVLWGLRAVSGVAICTCDLSPGSCDLNCCCDPDCSPGDPTNVFSFCLPGSTKAERWRCLYNWLIFRNNTPYPAAILGAPPAQLFCVSSADASLNYFATPQKVDAANFASVSDPYRGASFSPTSAGAPAFSAFYRAGDPVLTVSTSGALGALMQPAPLGDQSLCSDSSPARFLQTDATSCVRALSNLTASCEAERSLAASFYHQDVSVLRVPADATDQNAVTVPITSSVTAAPVLQGNVCNNVVTQVIYTVLYNGTQGITSASADFALSNVSTASALISQTFSVLYKPVASASRGSVLSRSGNPGYLVGLPVLSDIGRLRSLVGESCIHSDVQFGVNSLSGCAIRGINNETCSGLQERAYQVLVGGRAPGSLATFGNITAGQTGDRMPIIYQNCSLQGDCASSCLLPTSLHMQILWAQVGLQSNPQAQVLGARFVFRCQSVQCRDTTTLQTQVSFTDLTRRGPAPRSSPAVTGRAPLDFFFPFRSSAAGTTPGTLLLGLTLYMLTILK
ncbi:tectonic-3-like [Bufo bufo]|uniref:tectonic-3-like n=1 Tax=Bufo bufo TaxID=8384 RepID=UPI001ABE725D|nr:tectonic-3-like [Bufo bufo]